MGKYCIYTSCKSNDTSRHQDLNSRKFYPLPKPSRSIEKCTRWLNSIQRADITLQSVKRHHYVCEKHFFDGKGPTPTHPDPLPANIEHPIIVDNSSASSLQSKTDVQCLDKTCKTPISHSNLLPVLIEQPIVGGNSSLNRQTDVQCLGGVCLSAALDQATLLPVGIDTTIQIDVAACKLIDVNSTSNLDITKTTNEPEIVLETLKLTDVSISLSPLRLPKKQDIATSPIFLKEITSIENLAQDFLNYHAINWKSMRWSFEPIFESSNEELKRLRFKKTIGHKIIFLEVSSDMMPSIVSFKSNLSMKESLVDVDKPVSSLEDLKSIMSTIDEFDLCEGITGDLFIHFQNLFLKSSYICNDTQSIRSKKCEVFFNSNKTKLCNSCRITKKLLQQRLRRNKQQRSIPKSVNLRFMDQSQLQRNRAALTLKNKALKRKINVLERKVKRSLLKNGIQISEEESAEFEDILKKNPFESLLKEQWRILKSNISRPRKWHPAIIQWCIYLKAKSPSGYKALKQVYTLPSASTLYHYSRDIDTKSGFTEDVLLEMRNKIDLDNLKEHQKYFSLILDEIQIKEDLVFQSNTGELVGFQKLNHYQDKMNEVEDSCEELPLAKHILQLMVRGLTVAFKYPYAFFPSKKLTADDIYVIIWEAIKHLQGAGFNILTVVCDKASTNQKFIKMCTETKSHLDKIGFETPNIYNPGEPLFFISDVCHLVKTARNCISNSGRFKTQKDGSKKLIRLLVKNNKKILWQHFVDMYKKDSVSNLRLAPKINYAHVNVNAFSAMQVKLATQTMSSTTANAIEELIGEDATETVKLFRLFDKFFDILNVSNLTYGRHKLKPALEPFKSTNDWRFQWLEDVFLKYFEQWEEELEAIDVPEDLTKEKMMISKESLEGLRITVYSVIGAVKFLLNKGADFVLTAKFNQDPLERYFGKHRAALGSGENPTVQQYQNSVKRLKLMGSIGIQGKNGNCSNKKKKVERKNIVKKILYS